MILPSHLDEFTNFNQIGPKEVPNSNSGIIGLNNKTHLKLMLKWMRGRKMLKQLCNQVGSNKKFLLTTLPNDQPNVSHCN
ncbi:hypothetical protein UlMin_018199 [Ulmus minor]